MSYIPGTESGWAIIFLTNQISEDLRINAEWPLNWRKSPFSKSLQVWKGDRLFKTLCERYSTPEAKTKAAHEFYKEDENMCLHFGMEYIQPSNRIFLHIPATEKTSDKNIKRDRFEAKQYVPCGYHQANFLEKKYNSSRSIEKWWSNLTARSNEEVTSRRIGGRPRIKFKRLPGPKEGAKYDATTTLKMFAWHFKQGFISPDFTQDEIAQALSRTYMALDYPLTPAAIKKHLFTLKMVEGKRPTKDQVWTDLIRSCQQKGLL